MRRCWRIVKETHAASAFDGEGAWRFGGRWNSQGTRVVYASGSKALATLENLVHLNPPVSFKYVVISIAFDDALVEKFKRTDLPEEWTEEPPPPSTQVIGDQWVKDARSAVLELPSVIIRDESNYLLNPAHTDFKKFIIGNSEHFSFDSRLL